LHNCRKRRQRQGNPSGSFAGLDFAALLPALLDCERRAGMLRRELRAGIIVWKDFYLFFWICKKTSGQFEKEVLCIYAERSNVLFDNL